MTDPKYGAIADSVRRSISGSSGTNIAPEMVYGLVKDNIPGWFSLVTDPRNRKGVEGLVDQEIRDMQAKTDPSTGKRTVTGQFLGIPIVGDILKSIIRWYFLNTQVGRNGLFRMYGDRLGVPREETESELGKYDTSLGWFMRRPEGRAQ